MIIFCTVIVTPIKRVRATRPRDSLTINIVYDSDLYWDCVARSELRVLHGFSLIVLLIIYDS